MPVTVNCTSFKNFGICTHQAAPRRLFSPASCIVWDWEVARNRDPREVAKKCALCTPRPKPVLNVGEVNGFMPNAEIQRRRSRPLESLVGLQLPEGEA